MGRRTYWAWYRPPLVPVHHQALVLEWRRRDPAGWEALIVWVDPVAGRTVTEWVAARCLSPVVVAHPALGTAYG